MRSQSLKSFISDLLLGLGFVFIISPAILYWFIHGNYDRYIWIISGPYPFSHFGGGPFQLFVSAGLLIIGIGLIGISRILKRRS
ncbi:hypothetical protein [Rubeoparvulum massiliense]|uniref:hypothetical protein n=1 Tax=Rubeoparvulum massiliense TaxID=1631346 RepID=UPI00065E1E92|nr:hypothetical protein [Rubeoparvulum massiliense]